MKLIGVTNIENKFKTLLPTEKLMKFLYLLDTISIKKSMNVELVNENEMTEEYLTFINGLGKVIESPEGKQILKYESSNLIINYGNTILKESENTALTSTREYTHDRVCRLCHNTKSSEELISPCACCDDKKWVHRSCLNNLRISSVEAFSVCLECKFEYKTVKVEGADPCFLALIIISKIFIAIIF